MIARQYYDWCPHNTGNVNGCGVCKQHRDDIEVAHRHGARTILEDAASLREVGLVPYIETHKGVRVTDGETIVVDVDPEHEEALRQEGARRMLDSVFEMLGCRPGNLEQLREEILRRDRDTLLRSRTRADKLSQALHPAGMLLERLVAYVDAVHVNNSNNGDSLADLRADALAVMARLKDLPT